LFLSYIQHFNVIMIIKRESRTKHKAQQSQYDAQVGEIIKGVHMPQRPATTHIQ
jgi:hypothetical protein